MELWIRSQDKEELVKVSGTRIDYLRENEIIGYVEYDGSITLGIYATKERALEVLDEIQFAILCSGATWEEAKGFKEMIKSGRCSINVKTGAVIYEMPKE